MVDTQISQQQDTLAQELEELINLSLEVGPTLKDMHGFTDKEMEALYATAYHLYKGGRYQDALKLFKALCFFDHMQPKYWLGLGAVRQMLKDYQGAIAAYAYAFMLDFNDPRPPMYAAECLLAMGKKAEAESALRSVLEFSKGELAEEFKKRATALLDLLEKKEEENDKD